jgi:hypothetical protein
LSRNPPGQAATVWKWITSFPAKVVEGLVIAGIFTFLIRPNVGVLDVPVPLWVALLAVLVGAAAVLGLTARSRRSERRGLRAFHAEHLREILETSRKILAESVQGVSRNQFIERGILAPARHWLTESSGDAGVAARARRWARRVPAEEVRLSIITPDAQGHRFDRMACQVGHSVEASQNFSLEIEGTMAGKAYKAGEIQWSNDVENDDRWTEHTKARANRRYSSLVCVPINVGDRVVAVFNVLSTYKAAFSATDLSYIELLGAMLNVAWAMAPSSAPPASGQATISVRSSGEGGLSKGETDEGGTSV